MPNLIKVGMADYKVGAAPATLISYGLGSCIGLSLYDPKEKVGGLLHYMLPDSKQARPSDTPAKFIDTGFPLMLADVLKLGGRIFWRHMASASSPRIRGSTMGAPCPSI